MTERYDLRQAKDADLQKDIANVVFWAAFAVRRQLDCRSRAGPGRIRDDVVPIGIL